MFAWSRGSFIDKVAHLWPLPFWWAAVCLFLDGRVRAAAATARGSEWLTVALFICRGGGLSRGLGGRVRALPQPPLLRHRRFASLVSRLRVALSLSKGLLSHGFGGRKRAPSQPPHTAQNGSRWLSLFTGGLLSDGLGREACCRVGSAGASARCRGRRPASLASRLGLASQPAALVQPEAPSALAWTGLVGDACWVLNALARSADVGSSPHARWQSRLLTPTYRLATPGRRGATHARTTGSLVVGGSSYI